MDANSSIALAVTAGAATLVGGIFAWKLNAGYNSLETAGGIDLVNIARSIDVEMVGGLLKSEDSKVRKSAELFLIDRVSKRNHLVNILKKCLSNDIDDVLKAVTVIHFLPKHSDELKDKLLDVKVVNILVSVIDNISSNFDYSYMIRNVKSNIKAEKILFHAIGAMFLLVFRNVTSALQFCNEDACIKNIFLNIIEDDGFYISMDVRRWTTYMLHELVSLGEKHSIKKSLLQAGLITKVTTSLIMSLGDTLQTHLCLQIIVHYLYDSVHSGKQVCDEMLLCRILPHLVGLLRCEEDDSIVQLSAMIIHHFCCLNMEMKYLCSVPSMVKILFTVLNSSNALIQKIIVRVCNYLCVSSKTFHKIMVEYEPLVKRLSVCLYSGNVDVVFSTLMLVHDLIMQGKEFAFKVINTNPDILRAVVKLSLSYTGETAQIIPETLCLICSCESLHFLILKCGVLDAILHFAKSSDCEVKFWASALLLNLSMISDHGKEAVIRSGGVHILLEMAICGDELDFPDIAVNAAKTLVMIGFLDAGINVNLLSGNESSIIVDGTEHCPGKQGINLVAFDFINYKFKKGAVIKPSDLLGYFEGPSFSASACVFFVTQGDCTIPKSDIEKLKRYVKEDSVNLSSPSWCMIYMPSGTILKFGEDNSQLSCKIHLRDLLGSVLEENFTDPLIGVILSIPPSTVLSKLDELALIDILARHYHQRRVIMRTSGFLEYLFELLWNVASLKPNEYQEEAHKRKVLHAILALKIILSCCHKTSVKELLNRGLLQPLVALIQSLTAHSCINYNKSVAQKYTKVSESDSYLEFGVGDLNKRARGDNVEYPGDNNNVEKLQTDLSFSDDNIFHSNLPCEAEVSEHGSSSSVMVDSATDIFGASEMERETTVSNFSTPITRRLPSRNRTDSFIVRTDSHNRHYQNILLQRNMSVVNGSIYTPRILASSESNDRGETFTLSSRISRCSSKQTPLNHNQLRRLSRSMSFSLQQTKYSEDYTGDPTSTCDMLNSVYKFVSMISYRVINDGDEDIKQEVLKTHLLPFLYGLIGGSCGLYHMRISLALSSCVTNFSSRETDSSLKGLFMYSDDPKSIVISSNGLEVSNENWYFETVLANQPVSKFLYMDKKDHPAGFYYEVELYTDGVMQIGWAKSECKFDAEKGFGVGDTMDSCGFDGARCKIWNGPCRDAMMKNDYGKEWQCGDIVSILLSWNGELMYWLNGKDMGRISFSLDTDLLWYPGASLSIDQHCAFLFERSSLRFQPPAGYITISEVATEGKIENSMNTHEKAIRTLEEIFDGESAILSNPSDTFVAFYYEIDMLQLAKHDVITVGYDIFKERESLSIDGSYVECAKQKEDFVLQVVKTFPSTIIIDGKEKKVKTLGCGILSSIRFIITIDGNVLLETPLGDADVSFNDIFFHTVPHISKAHLLVNFGQNEYQYEHANTSRETFVENLCSLESKMEQVS